MKLNLLNMSICRTPAIPLNGSLEDRFEELKGMIAESSPEFYRLIATLKPEALEFADEKLRFSLWKYFNRSKYRATPFGRFAAISIVPVTNSEALPVIIHEQQLPQKFTDWGELCDLLNDPMQSVKKAEYFLANPTLYKIGQEFRYIRKGTDFFELAAVASTPVLDLVLEFCKDKVPSKRVFSLLDSTFSLKGVRALSFLESLFSAQLLLTDLQPNITGPECSMRLNLGDSSLPVKYIISKRTVLSGALSDGLLKDVSEAIRFLSASLPCDSNPSLESFKAVFLKKFEGKWVPLSLALDPEVGVGYDHLGEHQPAGEELEISDTAILDRTGEQELKYTELHKFLLNGMLRGNSIRLEDFRPRDSSERGKLPNTFSAIIHFYNGQARLQSVGGCTANSLLGRFTLESAEIESFCRNIASIEEKANPEVIFFDIAYQGEKVVDNVNRRAELYPYQASFLSWPCSSGLIRLEEILATVLDGEILLWSTRFQRRLIPRVATAYNYGRSDLAIYRFLSDLQFQNIQSNLNLDLYRFFPGLAFYPRVVYKNVIIAPAKWLVPKDLLTRISKAVNKREILLNWLTESGIEDLFKTGQGDQTLCFDPRMGDDIDTFLAYLTRKAGKDDIYISEALVSEQTHVRDEKSAAYAAEFVMSYYHGETIYKPLEACFPQKAGIRNDAIFPGGNWLYFEIYCHPMRADQILTTRIEPFVIEAAEDIKMWFFIRYTDPRPHLRLRLKLKDENKGYELITKLKLALNNECAIGLVSDIQLKTYFRETDRYGLERIGLSECFFYIDSRNVLKLLKRGYVQKQHYLYCVQFMYQMIKMFLAEPALQFDFVKGRAAAFSNEFNFDHKVFKILNRNAKLMMVQDQNSLFNTKKCPLSGSKRILYRILKSCSTAEERCRLLGDFIHMHVNRLFKDKQRFHEAVLYQYLFFIIKTECLFTGHQAEP